MTTNKRAYFQSKRKATAGFAAILVGLLSVFAGMGTAALADPTFNEDQWDAHLKEDHHGATNPGFGEVGDCPEGPKGMPYGWHFVFQGNDTEFVTLAVHFQYAGIQNPATFISHPSGKHAYVYTAGADTLVDAVANTNGGDDDDFNLSHICTPSTTTTSTTQGTTSTTAATTSTTAATTSTTAATTSTTAATTSTTQGVLGSVVTQAPTTQAAVLGNVVTRELPRTGSATLPLTEAGVVLVGVGFGFLASSRLRSAKA